MEERAGPQRLSCDFGCCGDQFGSVPHGLELFRNGKLRLEDKTERLWLEVRTDGSEVCYDKERADIVGHRDTHVVSVLLDYEDVHL